jgi:acetyl esterase/lipase
MFTIAFTLINPAAKKNLIKQIIRTASNFASTSGRRILIHRLYLSNMQPSLPKLSDVRCYEELIPTRFGFIPVGIYIPDKLKAPFPTVFHVPGSGFVASEFVHANVIAQHLALEANTQVINIYHRVAPENPYPAPLEDVGDVFKYVMLNWRKFNINKDKVVVSGYSSGAAIATEIAIRNKLFKENFPIRKQILICPFVDCSGELEKEKRLASYLELANQDKRITAEFVKWTMSLYAPQHLGIDLKSSSISPYWHSLDELADVAPAETFVGGKDRVIAQALAFAEKLAQAKIPSNVHIAEGEDHTVWWERLYFIKYVGKIIKDSLQESLPLTTERKNSFFNVRNCKYENYQQKDQAISNRIQP